MNMDWRAPKEDEHDLLIKFLKRESLERTIYGVIAVVFFLAMIAGAIVLRMMNKVSGIRATILIVMGALGVLIMIFAFKGDGKLRLARAKKYNICDCRVIDTSVSAGYRQVRYYVNVVAGSGKKYKVKVGGSVYRIAKEGCRAFIVGYQTEDDKAKLPWNLIIRKELDDEDL